MRTDTFVGACRERLTECVTRCDRLKDVREAQNCRINCERGSRACAERQGETDDDAIGYDLRDRHNVAELAPPLVQRVDFSRGAGQTSAFAIELKGPTQSVGDALEISPGGSLTVDFIPPLGETREATLIIEHGARRRRPALFRDCRSRRPGRGRTIFGAASRSYRSAQGRNVGCLRASRDTVRAGGPERAAVVEDGHLQQRRGGKHVAVLPASHRTAGLRSEDLTRAGVRRSQRMPLVSNCGVIQRAATASAPGVLSVERLPARSTKTTSPKCCSGRRATRRMPPAMAPPAVAS
jgi:hypothetical protein